MGQTMGLNRISAPPLPGLGLVSDLVDAKNGKLLEKADPARTKEFAEKWLKMRPQGGRVFIDSEGHASTLIDDRLVYLGNATELFT